VLLSFLPWLLPAALIALETRHAQPATHIERTAVADRPFVAGDALAFYLRKIVVPVHLTPDYGHTPPVAEAGRWFHVAWLLPTGLLIAAALAWRKMPLLLIGGLFFIVALLPVLGFVPFSFQMYSTVADHYLYVAMLGVCLIAAAILDRWWSRPLAVLSGAMIAILCVLTFVQSTHWHDTVRLFTRNLGLNPRSFVSHGQLGYLAAGAGDRETAAAHYAAALQIRPTDFFTNYNFGNLLLHEGKPAEAAARYEAALASESDQAPLHNNYGVALIQLHRLAEAIAEFEHALAIDPQFAEAKANLQRLNP
jgi:tetratricopeptide (TPR) repeat protein